MAKRPKYHITKVMHPDHMIASAKWGVITNREWCERETERLGLGAFVHTDKRTGKIAIAR